jgi:hypothetical protein
MAEGDHTVDINESLRDLVHMAAFTMALTNVSKVMSIVLDRNHSVNALEIFLVNSSYCADKTAHLPDRAAELTAFVDHVFHANSRRWVNFQPFLDTSTLPAAFLSWFGSRPSGRIVPVATVPVAAEPKGESKAAQQGFGRRRQQLWRGPGRRLWPWRRLLWQQWRRRWLRQQLEGRAMPPLQPRVLPKQ